MKILKITKEEHNMCIEILGVKIKLPVYSRNNHIYLIKNGKRKEVFGVKGLKIIFKGSNSIVEIGADPLPKFKNAQLYCHHNSNIKIGSSVHAIQGSEIISGEYCSVEIGKNFYLEKNGLIKAAGIKNAKITIGDDCMFSFDVFIIVQDGHVVYDINTNEYIGTEKTQINIGNHVWLCRGVNILKGSNIPDNCIVGNSCVVNKYFEKTNCAIAGIPAKIIKENINWDRRCIYELECGGEK